MISDYKPITINTDPDFSEVEIYFAHDIHYGSEISDLKKWDRFKKDILSAPNRFLICAGDYCETAILGSKSDIYTQRDSIQEQQLWLQQQFYDLKERIIAIVPGNHEARITKQVGLYPVYDAAVIAGIANKYRHHFAFVDIGVGHGGHGKGKQTHYVGYVTHRLRDCKSYHGADFVEGIDFAAYGHDHDPHDHARSKLIYDPRNAIAYQRDIEIIDSGSFMSYGGYAAQNGYRPQSTKTYKLVLSGAGRKNIKTIGFHL